jgi:predicted dehydrogenase
MLRLGLAGLGHGSTLLGANGPENQDLPIRVTALCDVDEARLSQASADYGVERTTTDFEQLVGQSDIDVIGIYTPGPFHGDQIVASLNAGKHVMVTKAMVYTMKEAEQVIEAVDRSGRVLLVTQTMRGDARHMESKRLCDSGAIGELILSEATYVHDLRPVYTDTPWRTQMPQDLLLGGACHPIDAVRWFMGDIEEVHCYGLRGGVATDYPQEDNFVINMRFSSGRIGRVATYCGVVHPPGLLMNGLGLFGTRGTIIDGRVRIEPEGDVPAREYEITFPENQQGHSTEMLVMMRHMADCVINGTKPWVGVREGARVVATGLACWESLRTGKPAKVRNDF